MKITAIELTNIRGFRKLNKTELSETINIFIGPNNSGKSTILNCIFYLQRQSVLDQKDITLGEQDGKIILYFNGTHLKHITSGEKISITLSENKLLLSGDRNIPIFIPPISEKEPYNLIYPYLSKRKVSSFLHEINETNANSVTGNFLYLFSKIDRLITPQIQPSNTQYIKACNEILGFEISSLPKGNGKQAVYFVHNLEHIPLTAMGEGVTNILGLIADLCVAENRIFLIEEPENDIHPRALKALLNLIVEKSDTNQIFISTHSNIVMKYLGCVESAKIFSLKSSLSDTKKKNLFISELHEVPDNPEARRAVLEDLGYEFYDFGLWDYWLFLEESSAEVLIREWFLKWFTPKLCGKIRTFSVNSTSQLIPKFTDFNKLFVFLHLEPIYKNKVWVIIDNGKDEEKIINELKEMYVKTGWDDKNFSQFSEHDFEQYYPPKFDNDVKIILEEPNKDKKREAKKVLLEKVKEWIRENEKEAKEQFKNSAASVIQKLKEIEKQIKDSNEDLS